MVLQSKRAHSLEASPRPTFSLAWISMACLFKIYYPGIWSPTTHLLLRAHGPLALSPWPQFVYLRRYVRTYCPIRIKTGQVKLMVFTARDGTTVVVLRTNMGWKAPSSCIPLPSPNKSLCHSERGRSDGGKIYFVIYWSSIFTANLDLAKGISFLLKKTHFRGRWSSLAYAIHAREHFNIGDNVSLPSYTTCDSAGSN